MFSPVPKLDLASLLKKTKQVKDCFVWQGGLNRDGYGRVGVRGVRQLVHRVAFGAANNVDSTLLNVVWHTCDNPACINPEHLRHGTQADNLADMCSKNREARGVYHGQTKLSKLEVEAIRAESPRVSQRLLAEKYGVVQATISIIRSRKTWNKDTPHVCTSA